LVLHKLTGFFIAASSSSIMIKMDGWVDLQINGLGGVDFNTKNLSEELWYRAIDRLGQDGTKYFLPTLITDSIESLEAKLSKLAKFCKANGQDSHAASRAVGIHLEGPFLSAQTGYVGAHPQEHAIALNLDNLKRLVDAADGCLKLVTLAPERDPAGKGIEYLAEQNILVAAGHCDPTIDQLRRAIDSGLSLFTHLGNACPPMLPRHDNIIQRVLALRGSIRVTLIADSFHLPLWLLDSWVDWFGEDRVSIISDAISAAGLPPGLYTLSDRKVDVGADGVPRSEDRSHFVGSGATLGRMHEICREELGWSAHRLEKLFKSNAAKWLGLDP
jgi:N-acetylglucosamine-6-phosphate deacetylase